MRTANPYPELDFDAHAAFHQSHNTVENQIFYDSNINHFKSQAQRIMYWLISGIEVSSHYCALQKPMIVDTRARIKKLKELEFKIGERKESFGKVWFCKDREHNVKQYNKVFGDGV
jgi:hypothetical protein